MQKKVLVLGATGSIGTNTLSLIRSMPERFTVCGLTANHEKEKLELLSDEFKCPFALAENGGIKGIEQLIKNSGADIAVNGIAGAAGLLPSVYSLLAGIDLALANKETVVMAWPVVQKIAAEHGARIIPVDSEHSAVLSLISKCGRESIDRIIITASGGPFRTYTKEQLAAVTPEDAMRHPTWSMGIKITIDSASLANKGLEVIEACRLFDIPPERVQVAVHPQSLVHSLVRTQDGVLYAQISEPDMRRPIVSALTWPECARNTLAPYDLTAGLAEGERATLTFEKPRMADFPMLGYAYEAAAKGGAHTIAYNAANEVAVSAFARRRISFMQIPDVVREVLDKDWNCEIPDIESVLIADRRARQTAEAAIARWQGAAQ